MQNISLSHIRKKYKKMEVHQHPIKPVTLTYYDDTHQYIDSNGHKYKSVSGWVSSFFEEFNTEKIATACAIKRGVSKQSLIDEWRHLGEVASFKGDTVHNMLASKFNQIVFNITNQNKKIVHQHQNQIDYIYDALIKILDPVNIEHIIFDPCRKIAGTYDALFITKDKTKYILIDWKTSKEIATTTQYNKWGYRPYEDLPDCNFIHYSLQLAEYERILKTQGYLKYKIPLIKKIVHVTESYSKSYLVKQVSL